MADGGAGGHSHTNFSLRFGVTCHMSPVTGHPLDRLNFYPGDQFICAPRYQSPHCRVSYFLFSCTFKLCHIAHPAKQPHSCDSPGVGFLEKKERILPTIRWILLHSDLPPITPTLYPGLTICLYCLLNIEQCHISPLSRTCKPLTLLIQDPDALKAT